MADHRVIISVILAFFFASHSLFESSDAAGIAISWGENRKEGSLNSTCATGNYRYVSITLAAHCNPSILMSCQGLSYEIKFCQSQGIKVLLSLGSRYLLSSPNDPTLFATYLYNSYLDGNGPAFSRPFGDAILDGIDFGTQHGSSRYWYQVARMLKEYSGDVFLAAAPECTYPDFTLGPAIKEGLFDTVWIKFFDNPSCQYDEYRGGGVRSLLDSWSMWSTIDGTNVLLGLPAAAAASRGGYMPPCVLESEVLPYVKNSPNYGGVMLWSRYYDVLNGYSDAIKGSVYGKSVATG